MVGREAKVHHFRSLHRDGCFIVPNPWDVSGAQILTALGFKALATTSSGYAFSQGKRDGSREVTAADSLEYAARIARSTHLPVTADLEDCYSDTASGIADVVRQAADAGLAGISIEDRQPLSNTPIRSYEDAVNRVEAAVEAARRYNVVLTARADGLGKGVYGIEETIRRLLKFEELGADVVYAPGVPSLRDLQEICRAVRVPVNHVVGQGVAGLALSQIAQVGVRRISVGGSLARAAGAALVGISRQIAAGDFSSLEGAPSWNALRNPDIG